MRGARIRSGRRGREEPGVGRGGWRRVRVRRRQVLHRALASFRRRKCELTAERLFFPLLYPLLVSRLDFHDVVQIYAIVAARRGNFDILLWSVVRRSSSSSFWTFKLTLFPSPALHLLRRPSLPLPNRPRRRLEPHLSHRLDEPLPPHHRPHSPAVHEPTRSRGGGPRVVERLGEEAQG